MNGIATVRLKARSSPTSPSPPGLASSPAEREAEPIFRRSSRLPRSNSQERSRQSGALNFSACRVKLSRIYHMTSIGTSLPRPPSSSESGGALCPLPCRPNGVQRSCCRQGRSLPLSFAQLCHWPGSQVAATTVELRPLYVRATVLTGDGAAQVSAKHSLHRSGRGTKLSYLLRLQPACAPYSFVFLHYVLHASIRL